MTRAPTGRDSWTTAPHFYLVREVNVGRLATWREQASKLIEEPLALLL